MKYVIQTNEGIAVVTVANEDSVNVSEVIFKDTGASEYIQLTEEELKAKPFVFTSTIANGELFVDTYRTKEFLKGIAQGKKKQEVMEATNDGELQVIIAKYANIEVSINNASNEAELLEVFNGMN